MPDQTTRRDQAVQLEVDPRPVTRDDRETDLLVVAIGASAGGLEACKKLLDSYRGCNGIAFILVQHLDPTHDSLLQELLAAHTQMTVRQVVDGMRIEQDYLYIIPPGTYLSLDNGVLHLSPPPVRHGTRLPFDFLLHSIAATQGPWAVGVVLSGSGTDGSLGLTSIKQSQGLTIVQDPDEAGYNGMPRNAILSGAADLVLPVAEIPRALREYQQRMVQGDRVPNDPSQAWLPRIIELLRTKTTHDFSLYKPATLLRRIKRRTSMPTIGPRDVESYYAYLLRDTAEVDRLAKDLLINVTGFFRDKTVFSTLAERIIPELVRNHLSERPIRVWVAGCSTG